MLKNWVKEILFFESNPLNNSQEKDLKTNNSSPLNPHQIHTAQAIEELRLALATDKLSCALLEEALHNEGLDGFANTLPPIAKKYGFLFSAEDFKEYLSRKTFKHQAAYLVQYCRGGGIS